LNSARAVQLPRPTRTVLSLRNSLGPCGNACFQTIDVALVLTTERTTAKRIQKNKENWT